MVSTFSCYVAAECIWFVEKAPHLYNLLANFTKSSSNVTLDLDLLKKGASLANLYNATYWGRWGAKKK